MSTPHPPHQPLYKYNKLEHIQNLTRYGKIRVGTLHAFRDRERYSQMIADKDEGVKLLTEVVPGLTKDTYAPLTRRVFGIPIGTAPPRDVVIRNNRITELRETKDLWMYCTSETVMSIEAAREVMNPTYDAVAVIHDPDCFGDLIARVLHQRHRITDTWYKARVTYGERERTTQQDDGIDPAILKPLIFSRQNEWRFMFVTHEPIKQPHIDLDIPELVSCCRILQDEEIPK